jgi:uncharacterized protein (TIGR03435 family)
MTEPDDHDLLAEFARSGSETAFAGLVARHVNLVHSAALRFTGNPHAAQEITQAVFIILARKAEHFPRKIILSGWLYQTARLTAANVVKAETRRQQREQEAYMQSTLNESSAAAWEQIAPLLDEAMGQLGETDRNAVVLRFFENKTASEAGAALKLTEAATHKRTERALEKLRKIFSKRGVTLTATLIAGAVAANSVQAAPVGLAKTISVIALTKGAAAGGSTLALVKGALKIMAWTKMKTAVVVGVGVLLAAGSTAVLTTKLVGKTKSNSADAIYEEIWAHQDSESIRRLEKAPPVLIIRPTRYPNKGGGVWARDGKGYWVNGSVSSIVGIAYNWDFVRTTFPDSLPDGHCDVMETLPKGQNSTALKEEIKKQFGLVAHKEARQTDVLLLKVSAPDKLQSHLSSGGQTSSFMDGDRKTQNYHFTNEKLSDLAKSLEGWFELPTIDRSGLISRYDFEFRWAINMTGKQSVAATLRDQLDQFGLELVPSREKVEMLVVEKVK